MPPRREWAPYRKALGRVVRERRSELQLSQEDVGFVAEVDRTYLTALEAGARNPTLETLLRISKALKMKPGEMLTTAESAMLRKGRR